MNAAMVAAIQAAMNAVRADNPASVVVRRGGVSLAAQTVRIAPMNNAPRVEDGNGMQAVRRDIVISGAPGLDIQAQDRITYGGALYEVEQVLPDRRFVTLAYGKVIQ